MGASIRAHNGAAAHPTGRHGFVGGWLAYRRDMIRTTPFHERTSALNETGLWEHWSNHLAAVRYQMSDKFEYFAVRNAAGLFNSSPLYKYRIHGPDAERYLAGVLTRDIRTCAQGTPSTRPGATIAASSSRTASCCAWTVTSSC